jgi:hypothetical protein
VLRDAPRDVRIHAIKIALVELRETRRIALCGFDEDSLVRLMTRGRQLALQARSVVSLEARLLDISSLSIRQLRRIASIIAMYASRIIPLICGPLNL